MVTYHPALPSVSNVLKKHWNVMVDGNQELKRCFPKPPMVGYRRGKNIKDELIRAKVSSARKSARIQKGYKPCGAGCQVCWMSKRTTKHSCPRTKKSWRISSHINCNSRNVIYKLTCRKPSCRKWFYLGETKRQLRVRALEHKGVVRRKVKNEVGSHFARGHGKNPESYLQIEGIERVFPFGDDLLRKRRESLWIQCYDAIRFGANTRD